MNVRNDEPRDQTSVVLPEQLSVVNVGLPLFGDELREQGVRVADVDWRIPAGGDENLVRALTLLYGPAAATVEVANREAARRLDEATPALVDVRPAAEVVPGIAERTVLHPGPPLEWSDFCDPLRRSVLATAIAEGWAGSSDDAARLVERGDVTLAPANDHSAALAMATTLGPSAPVLVVHNEPGGTTAYTPLNQGPGERQWLGVDSDAAVAHLRWLRDVAGPALGEALAAAGPVDLYSLAAQGVQMGDDIHMRLQASTNLLIRTLLPHIAALEDPRRVELGRFLSENYLFFLNAAIAAAKATTEWAAQVPDATLVTGMARNGTTFGIRLAATGQRWFTAPAPPVEDALYRGDYGPDDAAPDIGDSAIIELVGLGGAAAAASPAVAGFVGGRMADAINRTREVGRVCITQSSRFKIPQLDFEGTPVGVDVRKVVELGIVPAITTGILDATGGRGQIGAGLARAPLACFQQALLALAETYAPLHTG
ncbi:MAG TPA: DUF1116 domain-containing protein [Jiangellaceae bacterium]